jgi:hypothetical protein
MSSTTTPKVTTNYPSTPVQWCGEHHPHGPHRYARGAPMAWYVDCPGSTCNCGSGDTTGGDE